MRTHSELIKKKNNNNNRKLNTIYTRSSSLFISPFHISLLTFIPRQYPFLLYFFPRPLSRCPTRNLALVKPLAPSHPSIDSLSPSKTLQESSLPRILDSLVTIIRLRLINSTLLLTTPHSIHPTPSRSPHLLKYPLT